MKRLFVFVFICGLFLSSSLAFARLGTFQDDTRNSDNYDSNVGKTNWDGYGEPKDDEQITAEEYDGIVESIQWILDILNCSNQGNVIKVNNDGEWECGQDIGGGAGAQDGVVESALLDETTNILTLNLSDNADEDTVTVDLSSLVGEGLRTDCADSEILKWDGDAWECEYDVSADPGTGDGYVSGAELSGSDLTLNRAAPFNDTLTVDLSSLGLPTDCDNTQILKWDGDAWECEEDGGGASLWNEGNGNDIYRNETDGNVGIGTSTPSAKLSVESSASNVMQVKSTGTANNSATQIELLNNDESSKFAFGVNSSTHGSNPGDAFLWGFNAEDLRLGTNNTELLKLKSDGNVQLTQLTDCDTLDTDSQGNIVCGADAGAGTGEENSGLNLGTAGPNTVEVFREKIGLDLNFRRIQGGENITVEQNDNYVTINSTGAGGPLRTDCEEWKILKWQDSDGDGAYEWECADDVSGGSGGSTYDAESLGGDADVYSEDTSDPTTFKFRGISEGTGINVTQQTTDVEIELDIDCDAGQIPKWDGDGFSGCIDYNNCTNGIIQRVNDEEQCKTCGDNEGLKWDADANDGDGEWTCATMNFPDCDNGGIPVWNDGNNEWNCIQACGTNEAGMMVWDPDVDGWSCHSCGEDSAPVWDNANGWVCKDLDFPNCDQDGQTVKWDTKGTDDISDDEWVCRTMSLDEDWDIYYNTNGDPYAMVSNPDYVGIGSDFDTLSNNPTLPDAALHVKRSAVNKPIAIIGHDSSVGDNIQESIVIGHNSQVSSGDYSITVGNSNEVSGTNNFSFGMNADVSANNNAMAIGNNGASTATTASGNYALAIGTNSSATAEKSIALGSGDARALKPRSMVVGHFSHVTSNGDEAMAIGYNATAEAAKSLAIDVGGTGQTKNYSNATRTLGTESFALGRKAVAYENKSYAIGINAQNDKATSILLATENRKDLFISTEGKTGFNTDEPEFAQIDVNGKARVRDIPEDSGAMMVVGENNILSRQPNPIVCCHKASQNIAVPAGLEQKNVTCGEHMTCSVSVPKINNESFEYVDACQLVWPEKDVDGNITNPTCPSGWE